MPLTISILPSPRVHGAPSIVQRVFPLGDVLSKTLLVVRGLNTAQDLR